jgi:hypothetical protein
VPGGIAVVTRGERGEYGRREIKVIELDRAAALMVASKIRELLHDGDAA